MTYFGYTAMCEQTPVPQLVTDLAAAEDAGFDFSVMSDHYFPWLEEQGHSGYTWAVLGAAAHATSRICAMLVLCGGLHGVAISSRPGDMAAAAAPLGWRQVEWPLAAKRPAPASSCGASDLVYHPAAVVVGQIRGADELTAIEGGAG